jgi:hypothetical protein
MKARESAVAAAQRFQLLDMVQSHYADFIPFLEDVMEELGFSTSDIQKDIAGYIAYGPQNLMVQAQRGQAKTTIVAAFAVWALIHSPAYRVLIISAGGTQAIEISTLIVRIIMNMDVLECMRPDKMAGDRTSVEAFDIHHSLKGIDKSPSVACVGIDSNLQGKRADILIPDDVESTKNSATPVQRAKLLHLTRDFPSIADRPHSRILWMGTPQTMESIYTTLPARGVQVRVWPGRYPTPEQIQHYGANLAPIVTQRLARKPSLGSGGGQLGDQGQPLDPLLKAEDQLQKVELDQGTPYFQLQHMLNTALMDSMRHPLKTERLTLLAQSAEMPLEVVRNPDPSALIEKAVQGYAFKMARPLRLSTETAKFQSIWAYIDPAAGGANADETAYAIAGFLNGNVYLLSVGGITGGYELHKLEELARRLTRFRLNGATIEKNMGYGAFRAVFQPVLETAFKERAKEIHGFPEGCQLLDDLVSGQKEMRIINTLTPIVGRGALIVTEDAIDEDDRCIAGYAPQIRLTYSFFHQFAHISAARNALVHDDRVDAVEGVCRHFTEAIARDQRKAVAAQQAAELKRKMEDPLGYRRYDAPINRGNSYLSKRRTAVSRLSRSR